MFYKEILVDLPNKKRIRKTEPHYVYEVLQRKGKEFDKDIVMCVGVLASEDKMHPNEKYYQLHKDKINEQPLEQPPLFSTQLSIGSQLLTREILKNEGVLKTLKNCINGYEDLVQSLVEYYLNTRESSSQLYKYYAQNNYTGLNYIPSESTLSKFLNNKLDEEKIKEFKECWLNYKLNQYGSNSNIEIDFDSTNFNTSSSKIKSAEYGKAKCDEGLPQVNVAYFLDRKTGIPIYYDVYYGSINDMEHCTTAINKIRTINEKTNITFVMDRGYFSNKNLSYLRENNFSFLCMGKDTKTFSNLVNLNPKENISVSKNRIFKTTFGMKFEEKLFDKDLKKYYIYLYYDDADVSKLSYDRYLYAKTNSEYLIGKYDKDNHITNTFKNVVNIVKDENDIIIECTIKYDALDEYSKQCGYFYIVSNEDLELDEVLRSYRHRDLIEKQFKYSKTGCSLNKKYAQSDIAYNSKTFLGFLCGVVRASMITSLKSYFIQYSSETSQTVLLELQKIKAELISGKYVLKYSLTSRQKQIFSLFDLTVKDVNILISKINQDKIIG